VCERRAEAIAHIGGACFGLFDVRCFELRVETSNIVLRIDLYGLVNVYVKGTAGVKLV
jgi:hypothetical protein